MDGIMECVIISSALICSDQNKSEMHDTHSVFRKLMFSLHKLYRPNKSRWHLRVIGICTSPLLSGIIRKAYSGACP